VQVETTRLEVARPDPIKPLVSVVTVSLNAAHTIGDTIASVSMQKTAFALEHICVDGGSVDETRALIDAWAVRCGHIVRIYEPDTGLFDAMNKGLRAAKGEYVIFLNADDFLVTPHTIATAMVGLKLGEQGNPDIVAGSITIGVPGVWGIWWHLLVPRLLGRVRGFGLFPLHPAQFTKRSRLDAVGGFNTQLRTAADVAQYYELERKFQPTVRRLRCDITFMRAGGKSNRDFHARYRGARELHKNLSEAYAPARAAVMVAVKSAQILLGLRIGRCPHRRWFLDQNVL
jgi:glycosyltransferase involved in cell wall biosynthesis